MISSSLSVESPIQRWDSAGDEPAHGRTRHSQSIRWLQVGTRARVRSDRSRGLSRAPRIGNRVRVAMPRLWRVDPRFDLGFGPGRGGPVPEPGCALRSTQRQSGRRTPPISLSCLAKPRRPQRNRRHSRRRKSLSVSSFAVERIGVSTDSPERPRSCPWWSCGIDGKKIDERLLGQSRAQTNARPSDARSHPLRGRLQTSSSWIARLPNPYLGGAQGRSDTTLRRGGLEAVAWNRKHQEAPNRQGHRGPDAQDRGSLHRLPFKDLSRAFRPEERCDECLRAHHSSQRA